MSTPDISSREYWTEIEEIAKDVTERTHEDGGELYEVLHEAIDSHQWVIYTAYNYDVAKHSPNDDAWTDLYGGGDVPDNFDAVRAFCAMERDVCEHSSFGKLACKGCDDEEEIGDLDERRLCSSCQIEADDDEDDDDEDPTPPHTPPTCLPGCAVCAVFDAVGKPYPEVPTRADFLAGWAHWVQWGDREALTDLSARRGFDCAAEENDKGGARPSIMDAAGYWDSRWADKS